MNCPSCKIPLVMSDRQGIEIDYCPECRGIWLDRGELDKIIERSVNEPQGNYQANQQPFHLSLSRDITKSIGRSTG